MSCSMETKSLYQWAVLWEQDGVDEYGRLVVSPEPSEIKCRWENTRRQGTDERGNPVGIDAQVTVARDVPVGSAMWLGKLDDLPGTAYVPEADVMKVVSQTTTPDIKARHSMRVLSLSRSAEALPPTG